MQFSLLLVFGLFLQACLSFDPSTYPNKVVFKSDYTFYWRISGKYLQIGVQVNTLGWIGIGIGEKTSGSMPGADIAVISYAGNKPVITDHYATDFEYPAIDDCQNWVLVSHEVVGGTTTMVEVQRVLDTGDNQDRLIEGGTMQIVYAWGLNTQTTLVYHEARRGIYGVDFFPDPIAQPDPHETDLKSNTNLIGNFKVPTRTTTYACIAHQVPVGQRDPDAHVVRVEPILDPRSTGLAHHMLVHQCLDTSAISWAAMYLNNAGQCVSPIGMPFSGCSTLLYGWAMGIGPLNMPPDAGARMGYSRGAFQYIVTEFHYDNPTGIRGVTDNSGYKFYWTQNLRKYDAATITFGDPYISFPDIPANRDAFGLEASCPQECTQKFDADLHLFVSSLHMHATGAQMWSTHYRGNQYLGTLSRTDFFSFSNQHMNYINVTLKRGDRINTHCVFDTTDRTRSTGFGYASFSEMCMDFVGYYPRQEFGFGGYDFAYCGYYGYSSSPKTLCGSNQAFMTGQSILNVRNPVSSDLEQTREVNFGKAPAVCTGA